MWTRGAAAANAVTGSMQRSAMQSDMRLMASFYSPRINGSRPATYALARDGGDVELHAPMGRHAVGDEFQRGRVVGIGKDLAQPGDNPRRIGIILKHHRHVSDRVGRRPRLVEQSADVAHRLVELGLEPL